MCLPADCVNCLIVRRVSDPEAWTDLITEWEALDSSISPPTPFTAPPWVLLWWRHFRRDTRIFRDVFFGHIVRDRDGRLVALAPLMRTDCRAFGLPLIRISQFLGNDPSLTEFRGIICRVEDNDRVTAALAAHFREHRSQWDIFRWNGLRRVPSEYSAVIVGSPFLPRRELPDYIMTLPPAWADLNAHVSSNMRKNIRKAYEGLERNGISFTVRVVDCIEDVQPAVERFLALHAMRSEAADMLRHPNKFAEPRARRFLVDYLHRVAERGQLRIFELEIGSQVVASRLTFLYEDHLYLYFAGYDPVWRSYSVMTVLMTETIKWAITRGLRHVNLSTGKDQSKLRWKPAEIILYEAVQVSPTLRGRLAFGGFLAYEALACWRERRENGRRAGRQTGLAHARKDAAQPAQSVRA